MPQIKAHDEIKIKASIEDVWNVLLDIPNYPKWWPKLVNLKILRLNPEIIATEFQANPLGGKSFACRVINIIPHKEIKLDYYEGIYRGPGVWNIEARDGLVMVSYSVDLEIVDKSIALLSRIIPIPKLHSMIFKRILNELSEQVKSKK
jgi:ribosome-associated toxin RatA of RatAB toxin-antitoxin module